MSDGLRTVRVVTSDESLLASARSAVKSVEGFEVAHSTSQEELFERPPAAGDVLLIDSWLKGENVYELCRRLTGRTRCRTFLVVEQGNVLAEPIASFCGATGVFTRPITPSALRAALEATGGPRAALPQETRLTDTAAFELPAALLKDLQSGEPDQKLISALTDSETGLFHYGYLNFKLDEEFKRAKRFKQPLACVMLGFEGQAEEDVLRELAGVFLQSSRDTDLLGRFDENSFLFLLPHTGLDGAKIMAHRVSEFAAERGLADLVGDPLVISVGIATYPHPDIKLPQSLFGVARQAFFDARQVGGGVVTA